MYIVYIVLQYLYSITIPISQYYITIPINHTISQYLYLNYEL